MKNFRKINNLFVCEECSRTFNTLRGLSTHIQFKHNNREYYDKWIKDDFDDQCKICGKITEFINLSSGYKLGCCRKHIVEWNHKKIQKAIFDKYGVHSILCLKEYKAKGMIQKYGVESAFQSKQIKEKIKKTCIQKYGVDNPAKSPIIKEKIKNTCIKNLGVEYPTQSKIVKEKIKKTFLNKYGVEHALQHTSFFEKQQKNAYYSKKFKDTDIKYRGSYEFDFLEKFYDIYPDIQNASPIKYVYNDNKKIYFPDFYIPSLNLIIEIKNSYLNVKEQEKIKMKRDATIANNFKYIIIIDKDYKDFLELYGIH